MVQTSTVYQGSKALALQASTNAPTAFKLIAAVGEEVVFSEFYTIPTRNMDTNYPSVSSTCASAFFVNSNGYIVVFDGVSNSWSTLSHPAIATGTWAKITVRQTFPTGLYDMWLDGTSIVTDVRFHNFA